MRRSPSASRLGRSQVLRYAVRRLARLVTVLGVLSVLLFAWLHALPTRAGFVQVRLVQPLYAQYWTLLHHALTGDFGVSTGVQRGMPALEVVLRRLPVTLELSALALLLAVVVGIPLGYLAASRHGSWLDCGSVVPSLIGVTVPVFFVAFVLKFLFTPGQGAPSGPFPYLLLPALALSTIPFAIVLQATRASVLEVLDADYLRTARAKGLHSVVIRHRHVLRNAIPPVLTTIGLHTGALLAGAVLTERVFGIDGIGQALALGFEQRDFPVLYVVIVMSALVYVVVNLAADLSCALLDPRLRSQ